MTFKRQNVLVVKLIKETSASVGLDVHEIEYNDSEIGSVLINSGVQTDTIDSDDEAVKSKNFDRKDGINFGIKQASSKTPFPFFSKKCFNYKMTPFVNSKLRNRKCTYKFRCANRYY
jgi:hypothetical protein